MKVELEAIVRRKNLDQILERLQGSIFFPKSASCK